MTAVPNQGTAGMVEKLLACPLSHGPLRVEGSAIYCEKSGFRAEIRDEVAVMNPVSPSFFDRHFEVMQRGHQLEGERSFCYAQQTALLESYFRPGQVILDVGCGPSLPYAKPAGSTVIGLESSFESIRANQDVDLRVFGSADSIPMANSSVDIIACFYSIHHMVGANIAETKANISRAFGEFGRVLKPDGLLFVFEMTPMIPYMLLQGLAWDTARSLAPKALDMYFVSAAEMSRFGNEELPRNSMLERIYFGASAFTIIPPIFSLPWLKLPRLLYPLDAKLYKWRKLSR